MGIREINNSHFIFSVSSSFESINNPVMLTYSNMSESRQLFLLLELRKHKEETVN